MLYRFLNEDWYFFVHRDHLFSFFSNNYMFRPADRNASFKSFGFIDDVLNDNWDLDISCWCSEKFDDFLGVDAIEGKFFQESFNALLELERKVVFDS